MQTVLKDFYRIYSLDSMKLNLKYYDIKRKNMEGIPQKMTHKDVFRAYEELIFIGVFQDAIIIHAIYSLAIDPYTINLITNEGISTEKFIQYWDYKSSWVRARFINQGLINDIVYFKNYSQKKEIMSLDKQRIAPDGNIIEGTFVFTISPTNIYNRFARKFGNILKWFQFTPLNVIQLSRYKTKLGTKNFCPTLTSKFN